MDPTTLLTVADPLGRPTVITVLWGLVQIGVVAALALGGAWLAMAIWRERMVSRVARQVPGTDARELRRRAREVSLVRQAKPPKDPLARTHHVVVPPLGDGRPGEDFWTAAEPSYGSTELGPDGSRQDATVLLGAGVHMLVVCLGRIGAEWDGHVREPAAERARAFHDAPQPGLIPSGPVDHLTTAAGPAWRTTCAYRSGKMLTDTHFDYDGWAFVVGVLSTSNHPRAVELLDHVLSTWRWRPAGRADAGA